MKPFLRWLIPALLLAGLGFVAVRIASYWIRSRWPASIPPELAFRHEVRSQLKLRAIAERLPELFRGHPSEHVVCLGPTRGVAARVLFHAGPNNTKPDRNIHRPDYVLHVERLGRSRIALRLDVNRPYSYFRIRRSEMAPLREALERSFGGLTEV